MCIYAWTIENVFVCVYGADKFVYYAFMCDDDGAALNRFFA